MFDSCCDGAYMERVAGIEPASLAWKAKVLPLYHTRNILDCMNEERICVMIAYEFSTN